MNTPKNAPGGHTTIRVVWTLVNVALAIVAFIASDSDVWEAYITLFLASVLGQLVWMTRSTRR